MIQGLISDIHGNMAALEAVIADMEEGGAKRIICLGDVVGYGPFPGECLDMVQRCGAVLMGNHEEALLYGADNFNPRARRAIDWTREHIQHDGGPEIVAQRAQVLKNLKIHAKSGNFLFTHASPRQPTREYVMPRDIKNVGKMQEIFSLIPHVCFVGHTHVPGVFLEDLTFTRPSELFAGTYFIDPDEKALINIGSVGQPRDGDIRASYVLLDDEPGNQRVVFRRVEYDVEATASAIEANPHLDNHLAERLRHGR
ncbi:MAG: metallophosphoesterase [Planctomycetota bacterium]|nr:MAG: metallophosphoesterase [Planctomycetota bacterium]